jgi:RNA polymerase sigma factor (TIGR02999 family)
LHLFIIAPAKARLHQSLRIHVLEQAMETSIPNITQMLIAWGAGDEHAMHRLAPILRQELHRVASRHMTGERQGHIPQTTALVNEVYLRLIDWKNVQWQNRAHFFAMASKIMRRVLVDYARAQHREKRGGNALQVTLSEAADIPLAGAGDIVAPDEALQALERPKWKSW